MKAASAVLIQVQRQMTLIGLPISLLLVAGLAGVLGFVLPVVFDFPALVIPGGIVGFFGAWIYLVKHQRINPNYDRDLLVTPMFWGSRKGERLLTTGGRK